MIEFVATNKNAFYAHFSEKLMEEAFPLCERPSFMDMERRDSSLFHACTILKGEEAVGLFNFWSFSDFDYIEHFAISPQLRNNGIGQVALQHFLQKSPRMTILEAELPTNELAERRLLFYQRNGFFINPHPYIQPAYRPNGETLAMNILSTQELDDDSFEKVRHHLYRFVYKAKL